MQASEIPERAGLIPDSPSRIPDSGFPLPAVPVERRGFARFYAAYPKKVGKGDAEKAFKKLSPSPELLNRMLEAIEKAKDSESWLESGGKYIPNPATWLNGKRWEDELKPAGTTPRAAALSLEEQNRAANEEARRLLFGDRREVFHA